MKVRNRKKKSKSGNGETLLVNAVLRQQAMTKLKVGFQGLLALALSGFLLVSVWEGGHWVLRQLLYENDYFSIKKIQIVNDGLISKHQVASWANLRLGRNLFALDLPRVKRDLEMIPWIRDLSLIQSDAADDPD